MLPPRGRTPTAVAAQRSRDKDVNAALEAFVGIGELRQTLGRYTPATPSVNGIYMRDGAFKTWKKYGQKYGNTNPMR